MSEQVQSQEEFLANFNWHNFEEGIDPVNQENLKEFEELVTKTFISTDQEEVDGTVVRITDRDVIVDINAKSEGVISLNEFRYNPALKVGDTVEVLIDIREDKTGQLVLSHRKARTIKSWDRVISANETGEIVNGFVKCRTKGGMIVDVFGIEAFLPGSQIDVKPIRDYDVYVNKTMEFKVVKINHEFKTLLYLTKRLLKRILKYRKKKSSVNYKRVLEGVVKNITLMVSLLT
jgi:small subunit ribosomal protein S1